MIPYFKTFSFAFGTYIIYKVWTSGNVSYKGEDPSIPDGNTNLESAVVRNNKC